MQATVINLNGQILTPDEAKVSVFDRAYLYGDSLYEVIRSWNGRILFMEEHLNRLEHSASLCRMVLGQTTDQFRVEINKAFEVFKAKSGNGNLDAYIRLIVSRGIGKIGFSLDCLLTPSQYTVIVKPIDPLSPAQFEKGLRLSISSRIRNDRRALDPAMKSGNYLNNLLAFLEAATEGYDDTLLCNAEGHIAEGTTFNIFYVRRGIVVTPPLEIGILDGITRRQVLNLARGIHLETREVRFPEDRLYEADEVFLTSTLKGVFPVTHLDQKRIGNGKAGPITRKLRVAFDAFVQFEGRRAS